MFTNIGCEELLLIDGGCKYCKIGGSLVAIGGAIAGGPIGWVALGVGLYMTWR